MSQPYQRLDAATYAALRDQVRKLLGLRPYSASHPCFNDPAFHARLQVAYGEGHVRTDGGPPARAAGAIWCILEAVAGWPSEPNKAEAKVAATWRAGAWGEPTW